MTTPSKDHTITNCTPHPIAILACLFDGRPDCLVGQPATLETRTTDDGPVEVYVFQPSGLALRAMAVSIGDPLSTITSYGPTDDMLEELKRLRLAVHGGVFPTAQHLVVCSAISARAVPADQLESDWEHKLALRTPVFAAECSRLPMAQRWADRLAVA